MLNAVSLVIFWSASVDYDLYLKLANTVYRLHSLYIYCIYMYIYIALYCVVF